MALNTMTIVFIAALMPSQPAGQDPVRGDGRKERQAGACCPGGEEQGLLLARGFVLEGTWKILWLANVPQF